MRKVIVTGCTSFIGVHLTTFLLKNGCHVIGVCRDLEKAHSLFGDTTSLSLVCLDMDNIDQLPHKIVLDSVDTFFHLAWEGAGHEGRNNKDLQLKNVLRSIKAVEVAKCMNASLFVEAGSQAEYGQVSGVLKPETECHPDNEYGKAKLIFGVEADYLCRKCDLKFIHLRILSLYGEGDKDWTMIINSVNRMLNNEDILLSQCSQTWNYLYIRDAVKQMYLLSEYALRRENFKSEVFLIGSNDSRPLRSYIEEMCILTKSKSKLLYGYYKPLNNVELHPDMSKTELATGGFLSEYSFADGINIIIESINKSKVYE